MIYNTLIFFTLAVWFCCVFTRGERTDKLCSRTTTYLLLVCTHTYVHAVQDEAEPCHLLPLPSHYMLCAPWGEWRCQQPE